MVAAFQMIARAACRLLAAGGMLLLAACGSADENMVDVAYVGAADSPFDTGLRLSGAAQLVRAATAEGLVGFDEQARVVPGLADRWIVTDDGLSYIFRLRDGTWEDGAPLTAETARASLRRILRQLRGTSLGLDLAGIDEVRVMAQRVIEIRLSTPKPNLLQLLAQPELGLMHGKSGAGPMTFDRSGEQLTLSALAPQQLGLPQIEDWNERVRTIRFAALPAATAIERFNDGDVDLVLGGTIADFPLTRSVGLLRGTIQLDPVSGLFGLVVLNDSGFLEAPANREAIALAIDRTALIEPFGVSGWKPSTRIVASDVEGDPGTIGERWDGIAMDERRAMAGARVSAWKSSQDDGETVRLTISLPDGPGSDMLFSRLSGDLAQIGIELARAGKDKKADLELIDDVARYPRAAWYLNRLNCTVRRSVCSRDADRLVAEAAKQPNEAEQRELLAEAEADLTLANAFLPFGAPIRWSLVRGDATGFAANRLGWHPLMPMARRTK